MTQMRLLLLEDSLDDEKLIIRQFKKSGFEPIYQCLQTADELSLALIEQVWDIIISDYQMAAFSGLEALSLVKNSGLDIPFILVSGAIGEEIAVEAMRAGADDYLMKDNIQRLIPAVERAIREAENRRQRHLAERRLEQMRLQMESIVTSAMDAIITTDSNQLIVMTNKAAEQMFNYPPTVLVGKKLDILVSITL